MTEPKTSAADADARRTVAVASPDGRVVFRLQLADRPQGLHCWEEAPGYRVEREGREVVADSLLGLLFDGQPSLRSCMAMTDVEETFVDETWSPLYGIRRDVREHCCAATISLRESVAPHREWSLEVRVYNEAVAFRYRLPASPTERETVIDQELTEFCFSPAAEAWESHYMEDTFRQKRLTDVVGRGGAQDCNERPFLVKLPRGGPYVWIHEAAMDDYARMQLSVGRRRKRWPDADGSHHGDEEVVPVKAALSSQVRRTGPLDTPWRLIGIVDEPRQLPDLYDRVLGLNKPCALAETDWIRPGIMLRDWDLSTRSGKALADFAAAHGIAYILYDGGWYGNPWTERADPTDYRDQWDRRIRCGKEKHGGLDLPEVIRYARSKGVGTWLYVDKRALERDLERMLATFAEWGVAGVKFGFVNTGPQGWTNWLHAAVRRCADFRMMVDIHDEYRPTGLERTWPHLLTVEGIRGNEHCPGAKHNVDLPFIRYPAGPGDYTPTLYLPGNGTTLAHQLAMLIVYYSPLQDLRLYLPEEERRAPDDANDDALLPGTVEAELAAVTGRPEMAFIRGLPTTWEVSTMLAGEVGKYVVMARRCGKRWYVGVMAGAEGRGLRMPLDFLPADHTWNLSTWRDKDDGRRVERVDATVNAGETLSFVIKPCGGMVMVFTPQTET